MISQRLANFQFRFLTPIVTTLTFVALKAPPLRISSISICLVQRYRPEMKTSLSHSLSLSPTSYSHGARWGREHVARRHSRLPAKRGRRVPVYLYRRQSDFRCCKRLYMARCKGGPFDTTRPIMRRYIRRASIVNTTSLSISLPLSILPRCVPSPRLSSFTLSLFLSIPLSLFFLFI